MKLKDTCSSEENYDTPRQCIKKQTHHLADRSPHSQRYGLSSSHVWMWELDHKEDWAPKNWCFWTVVSEKTLESPSDCKEIKPADSKVNQPWVFIGKNEAESEASILWPPDAKSQLIRKHPDAEKDWRLEKGMTEDEMIGWHHRLDGHEFEQALADSEGQGSQACCSLWGSQRVGHDWAAEQQQIPKILNKPSLTIPFLEIYPIQYVRNNLGTLPYFFNCKILKI